MSQTASTLGESPGQGDCSSSRLFGGAIRTANRAAIVGVLRRRGQATRAELCRLTGLSRATVSTLLGELAGQDLICEQRAETVGLSGRPPSVVTLDRSAGLAIGIDIGVQHLAVAVGDLARAVHAERWWPEPVGHSASEGIATVVSSVETALREAGADRERLIGAMVSVAAPIRADDGTVAEPNVLPGWAGTQLAAALSAALRVPVAVDNDATLGALGELTWGPVHTEAMVYVKLASRVGAGLYLRGELYHGIGGYAGELGHVVLDPDGPPCWCGSHGCLEVYAGGAAMLRVLAARGRELSDLDELVRAALAGDSEVTKVVRQSARYLGRGLADLVNLVNPSHIAIGGGLSPLGEHMLGPLREELLRYSFAARLSGVQISTASLGKRASQLGALALVLTQPSRFVDGASRHTADAGPRRRSDMKRSGSTR